MLSGRTRPATAAIRTIAFWSSRRMHPRQVRSGLLLDLGILCLDLGGAVRRDFERAVFGTAVNRAQVLTIPSLIRIGAGFAFLALDRSAELRGFRCRRPLFFDPALVGDPVARRKDHLPRPCRTDTLDLEVVFVGFGQLLSRTEAPLIEQLGVNIANPRNSVER